MSNVTISAGYQTSIVFMYRQKCVRCTEKSIEYWHHLLAQVHTLNLMFDLTVFHLKCKILLILGCYSLGTLDSLVKWNKREICSGGK